MSVLFADEGAKIGISYVIWNT